MKASTTYTARLEGSYVNWSGDLELRIGNDERIELSVDLKTLKDLHRQIGERVKKIEVEQLEKLREQLEKATDE
jgi:hypothetical protein